MNTKQRIGRIAIGFSTVITCLWAFWGASEMFHEGWYYESIWMNLGQAVIQYLSPMLIFMGVGILSIQWPRVGAVIHIGAALLAAWFFHIFTNTVVIFILVPLVGIGLCYWFGDPSPRKAARRWMVGLPLLIALVAGALPAYRVSQRIGERRFDAQTVQGNGISLTWAPGGPGWPQEGANWLEATQTCQFLSRDGKTMAATAQNIWRLPTVDEAVRSMALHGENSGGVWDDQNAKASYVKRPDKEFPLWDIYSPVIYWWTASEVDRDNAYMIVYDGRVWSRAKSLKMGDLGFRCVKSEQ